MLDPITGKQTEITNQNPLSEREDGLAPPEVHGRVEEGRCLNQIRLCGNKDWQEEWQLATTKAMS